MHYSAIKPITIENGIGCRVSFFVSGCNNHCEDCFQPETWNFNHGQLFTRETLDKLIELMKPEYITGITLLGGEPMEPQNQDVISGIVKELKDACPRKTIWCYTGFKLGKTANHIDNLRQNAQTRDYHNEFCLVDTKATDPAMIYRANTRFTMEILNNIDVLVDGRFDKNLKSLMLKFRGSSNQRVIDMPTTLRTGTIHIAVE